MSDFEKCCEAISEIEQQLEKCLERLSPKEALKKCNEVLKLIKK